jgi:hypothetical protein
MKLMQQARFAGHVGKQNVVENFTQAVERAKELLNQRQSALGL